MAHWAEIDDNKIVLRVLVTDSNDPNGDEGYQWIMSNLGGTWIKASYNDPVIEKNAGIGLLYDKEKDVYVDTHALTEGINLWLDPNTNRWERI